MISEIFALQNPWRTNPNFSFHLKEREVFDIVKTNLDNELIIGLIGSRQVGKSSILYLLIKHLLNNDVSPNQIFYFNLDDLKLHELFTSVPGFLQFTGKTDNRKYVFIDEIQRLNSPGLFLKELFDLKLDVKIIYSGSSQLEIKSKIREHLVGRARVLKINRLSFNEYLDFAAPVSKKDALAEILIYGSYPAVAKEKSVLEKKLRLRDIFQSYIQKDLIDFLKIDNVEGFNKFLIFIANQTADLLNIHSLSKSLAVQRNEIEKYINILEYTFVCNRVYPFYKNYSKEITKTPKIYFLDSGLRNFILNRFEPIELRTDIGKLFENFVYTEMLCADFYSLNRIHYWRTTNQTEIDFIVESDEGTKAIEVKWDNPRTPKSFQTLEQYYPEIKAEVVTRDNFID
ncbi:MAG: ATP-binding protein [Draconibacterium sp.]